MARYVPGSNCECDLDDPCIQEACIARREAMLASMAGYVPPTAITPIDLDGYEISDPKRVTLARMMATQP